MAPPISAAWPLRLNFDAPEARSIITTNSPGPRVGAAAKTVFALALVAAGFASAVTGMMASAYGVGGFLHRSQHHHDKPFRLIAAAVTAIALVVVTLDADALWLMVGSQAALAVLLPATVIPLMLLSRRLRRRARAGELKASAGGV